MRAFHFLLAMLVLSLLSPRGDVRSARPPSVRSAESRYGALPMRFEANAGQSDPGVRFVARRGATALFLTEQGATLSLRAPLPPAGPRGRDAVLRMKVTGARDVAPRGEQRLATISNYFIGNDPSKWCTDVPNFGRVVYPGVLPGVDLVYHGEEGQLEYDFIVAPGADSGKIAMEVSGARELSLTSTGELAIHTEHGVLVQPRPRVYQHETSGERKEVAAGYRLMGESSVGFAVASYDRSRELVIDPVLQYSTYLGGAGTDAANRIAVDTAGSAYVTGYTESVNFPTQNPFQPAAAALRDVFVAKLSAAGTSLVYATYLGGSQIDSGGGIAVDAAGSAYVTGSTGSANFPTRLPLQAAIAGSNDAFLAKLSPAGNALEYSTYLGGIGGDGGGDVAIDAAGSAYVTGSTASTNFPTQNPFQGAIAGGRDVFLAKLSPSGGALVYSTYLGGAGDDVGHGVAVDGAGHAYVTGSTASTGFPTQTPFQAVFGGGPSDVFVTKVSPSGSSLVYSTFLGGSAVEVKDSVAKIAVDAAGSAYVAGSTQSSDFPKENALQAVYAGIEDSFVTKLVPSGDALVYSTYLGGSRGDANNGIALDGAGAAHVVGITDSVNFPTQAPFQAAALGGTEGYIAKLAPDGRSLEASSYFGGMGSDYVNAVAVDGSGSIYVTGYTNSAPFPTRNPFQAVGAGGREAYVAKIVATALPVPTLAPASASVPPRDTLAFAAAGGSGVGFVFSLQTNASRGTVDPATGLYTAGPTGSVTDVVKVTDSAGESATATIRVGPGVSLSPPAPSLTVGGSLVFTAAGGSGVGFVFSFQTNASGATLDAVTGRYTAGSTAPASDVVLATDSLGNTATARILVSAPPPDASAPDSSVDGSVVDASPDASAPDSSAPDVGAPDSSLDAGPVADSGPADASPAVDSSPSTDAAISGSQGDTTGCGCRSAGAAPPGEAAGLALLGLAALVARRRRVGRRAGDPGELSTSRSWPGSG